MVNNKFTFVCSTSHIFLETFQILFTHKIRQIDTRRIMEPFETFSSQFKFLKFII